MEIENQRKRKRMNLTQCSRDYFTKAREEVDEKGVKRVFYRCKTCNKELNGTYESNLAKHLQKHTDVFQTIDDLCEEIDKKRLKLMFDCVELVSVNGNPFNRLLDSGLLSILDKTLKELEAAGKGINLTDPKLAEVKDMLEQTAKCVQQKMCDELTGRPLCLMLDITTKRRRSILGVSVQFIKDGKHIVRSIGMLQLHQSHTGEYLAQLICDLLSKFNIKPQQVIAITTDNGSNVLKMIRDLSSQIIAVENNFSQIVDCAEVGDADIENYLQNVQEATDEEALRDVFDMSSDDEETPETHENLLNAVVRNVQYQNENSFTWNVQGIHCTPHTLQLCIKSAVSSLQKPIQNVITLCRRIAKILRLKSSADELKAIGIELIVPHIDVETRWCSTYVMVRFFFFFFKCL